MTSHQYNIALVGCGKMGGAMLRSWLENDLISNCYIIAPSGVPDEFKHYDCVLRTDADNIGKHQLDAIILAVKPQKIEEACAPFAHTLDASVPIISIAAGKSIAKLEDNFKENTAVIRTMPNTPSAVGKGACVCIKNNHVNDAQQKLTTTLLETTGLVEWIDDETLMDAVTAVSGSGPAYIFYLIETLALAGENAGLSTEMAMKLARQTVIGSASLAERDSDLSATKLRENVTSPNGTTYAALKVLMDGRMETIFKEAIEAAKKRSEELNS